MNKKQEFDSLIKGDFSNKKTIFRPIIMHFAARYSENTYAEFASDYKVLVESNVKALEDFNLDMVGLISDPYRETSAFGAPIEYIKECVPKCLKNIVSSIDDIKNLKNPDVHKAERTLDRIKGAEYFQHLLKGNVPVIGWVEGPLAEACNLVGVSEMLLKLMMEPDFTQLVLDKCIVTAKEFAAAQINAGCDIIGIGDAICSQIDIDTYRTFVKDRHIELINHIHSMGAKVKLHICGDINHLINDINDLAVDILDCDHQVDMENAYQILGEKVMRCGNLDPVDIQEKSEEELFIMTQKLVQKEKNRPFILSGGCEITVNTPPVNIKTMRKSSLNP